MAALETSSGARQSIAQSRSRVTADVVLLSNEPRRAAERVKQMEDQTAPAPGTLAVFLFILKQTFILGHRRGRWQVILRPQVITAVIMFVLFCFVHGAAMAFSAPELPKLVLPSSAPFLMMWACISMGGCTAAIAVDIALEKETKMKEIQCIAGVPGWVFYSTQLIAYAVYGCMSACVMSTCFCALGFVPLVLPPAVWLTFYVNILYCVALGVLLSSILPRSTVVGIAGTVTQLALPVVAFANVILAMTEAAQRKANAGPPDLGWESIIPGLVPWYSAMLVTMENTMLTISLATCDAQKKLGVTTPCAFPSSVPMTTGELMVTSLTPVQIWGVVACAIVVITFLALYVDTVMPGDYGSGSPLCWCLMCPRRKKSSDSTGTSEERRMETCDPSAALSLRNLTKTFGHFNAVDGLTFDVDVGELFALLGHNGAGKTTTINLLTGMLPVTEGSASIAGCCVTDDRSAARQRLSLCPQDNPLYAELLVREHLMFFCTLRGCGADTAAMVSVLEALGIAHKLEARTSQLSGGQKRRLWCATALLTTAPLAFLDEPTSGMDPWSRRQLWALLGELRERGRSIVFTTHYLEEADLLAQRKAIVAKGRLLALGSSADLKQRFGVGYNLEIARGSTVDEATFEAEMRTMVLAVVPEAQSRRGEKRGDASGAGTTVVFGLPWECAPKLGGLLQTIENQGAKLGVLDYSIAMTSLEEVFMKLGRQAEYGLDAGEEEEMAEDMVITTAPPSLLSQVLAVVDLRQQLWIGTFYGALIGLVIPCCVQGLVIWKVIPLSNNHLILVCTTMPAIAMLSMITAEMVRDKEGHAKRLAESHGMSRIAYWVGAMVVHVPVLGVSTNLVFAWLLLFRPDMMPGQENWWPLLVTMMCVHPFTLTIWCYFMSLWFSTSASAIKMVPFLHVGIPLIGLLATDPLAECVDHIPCQASNLNLTYIAVYALQSLFAPLFGLPATYAILQNGHLNPALWSSLVSLPLYGSLGCLFMYGTLLIFVEHPGRASFSGNGVGGDWMNPDSQLRAADAKVKEEAIRVHTWTGGSMGPVWPPVLVSDLHHAYPPPPSLYTRIGALFGAGGAVSGTKAGGSSNAVIAVRGISLAVPKGELFTLLGPNGAGKTTTLAAITGEIRQPSGGSVRICGKQPLLASRESGFCPQFDCHWPAATGRQHLTLYAKIKGVPPAIRAERVQSFLMKLQVAHAADRPVATYSGGMKRKISMAMSLIGQPAVCFMDEPSAGVDVVGQRYLWQMLLKRTPDQTVVLTTHSMEEADALSDRLAVQVNGSLRCLGNVMHIKSTYGGGCQLEVFVRRELEGEADVKAASADKAEAVATRRSSVVDLNRRRSSNRALAASEGPSSFAGVEDAAVDAQLEEETIAARRAKVVEFVTTTWGVHGAAVSEEFGNRLLFTFPNVARVKAVDHVDGANDAPQLSALFSALHEQKSSLDIEHYGLSQPTLEQVFLHFAREQIESTRDGNADPVAAAPAPGLEAPLLATTEGPAAV